MVDVFFKSRYCGDNGIVLNWKLPLMCCISGGKKLFLIELSGLTLLHAAKQGPHPLFLHCLVSQQ